MMARGVNKVILLGNIGKEPEIRVTGAGACVATLSLATSESWKDKQTGQKKEKTEWHRVVFFNKLAEIVRDYVKKGSKLYVEGKLQTRKWQDQNGNDRYSTEVIGSEMEILSSPQTSQSQAPQPGAKYPAQLPSTPAPAQAGQNFDSFDDDIPF